MKLFSFRNLRVLVLLVILALVAIYTKQQHLYSTSWLEPLQVVIFPINADGNEQTSRYIANLDDNDFTAIDRFTAREAKRYKLYQTTPTITRLGPTITSAPPTPPEQDAFVLKIALWSMRMRYWAWQNTPDEYSNSNRVRIFVLYHAIRNNQPLQHSLGLQKGLFGIVHVYASGQQEKQNNIVIAHELMHTVGATDKYAADGSPVFPDGYAQPERVPLLPQYRAEIMSGRIPTSTIEFHMAKSLDSCVIGSKTASEISWLDLH